MTKITRKHKSTKTQSFFNRKLQLFRHIISKIMASCGINWSKRSCNTHHLTNINSRYFDNQAKTYNFAGINDQL